MVFNQRVKSHFHGDLETTPTPNSKPNRDYSSQRYRRDNHEQEDAKTEVFAKLGSRLGSGSEHLLIDHTLGGQSNDYWCAHHCRKRGEKRSLTGTHNVEVSGLRGFSRRSARLKGHASFGA